MKPACRTETLAASPAIHTYFDVCPESPDGKRVVYFQFDGKPLTDGKVMVMSREDGSVNEIIHCAGIPHSGAKQGWLDNEDIYFSSDSEIFIASAAGEIKQRFPGSINTFCPETRRGLASSVNWRGEGKPPKEAAIYRIDIHDESMHELLDREQAIDLCAANMDMSGVNQDFLFFKNSKWAPGGKRWFSVFTNEKMLKENPDLIRVKVLIAADDQGNNARLIGEFGHHPKWSPDGSFVYAFGSGGGQICAWDGETGERRDFCRMPGEGHPSLDPSGRWMVSDSYDDENRLVAIHCHDIQSGETVELYRGPHPHVDWQTQHPPNQICHAHPVWSSDGNRIYFNAVTDDMPELRVIHFER